MKKDRSKQKLTKEDFEKILNEETDSSKKYEELRNTYLIQMVAIPLNTLMSYKELKNLQKEKGWTDQYLMEQIQKNDTARAMAYEDAIEPFLKKWFDVKKINQIYCNSPIAILYEVYLTRKEEYEWDKIVNRFQYTAEQENTTMEQQIQLYLNWMEEHRIKIRPEFYELFSLRGSA
jgi:hypothetical protein